MMHPGFIRRMDAALSNRKRRTVILGSLFLLIFYACYYKTSGPVVRREREQLQMVTALQFLSNSRLLAATSGGSVTLIDVDCKKHIWRHEVSTNILSSIAISPDGKTAVIGGFDSRLFVINPVDGAGIDEMAWCEPVKQIAFLSQSRLIVCGVFGALAELDLATGNSRPLQGLVSAVDVDGIHGCMILGSWGGSIQHECLKEDAPGHIWPSNHVGAISAIAVADRGEIVVTGGFDSTVKRWAVSSRRLLGSFKAHEGAVKSIRIGSDNHTVVTAGTDGSVKIWAIAFEKLERSFAHAHSVESVAISPDLQLVAVGTQSGVTLWNLRDGTERVTLPVRRN
jgi:WD40 repeat protein